MKNKVLLLILLIGLVACNKDNGSVSSKNSSNILNSTSTSLTFSSSSSQEDYGKIMSEIDEILKSYVPEVVEQDIILPTSLEGYDVTIYWASQSPNIISSEGEYNKPINDTNVILTATYQYKDSGVHKVEIVPKVYGYSDEEKLEMFLSSFKLPNITLENNSITLPTYDYQYGVSITWNISENEYITFVDNVLTVSKEAFVEGTSFGVSIQFEINEAGTIAEYEFVIDKE